MKYYFSVIVLLINFCVFAQSELEQNVQLAKDYEQSGDNVRAAFYYNKVAYDYWNNNDAIKAKEYFEKLLLINTQLANVNAQKELNNIIGILYVEMGKPLISIDYFNQYLLLSKNGGDLKGAMSAYVNKGNAYMEAKQYSNSIEPLEKALEIASQLNDSKSMMRCYGLLAESNESIGQSQKAMEYFNLFAAIDKELKKQKMAEIEKEVVNISEDRNRKEKELNYKTGELRVTQDSLNVAEKINRQKQMEIELKESEIRAREAQLRNERLIRNTLIIGILFFLLFLLLLFYQFKQIKKTNKIIKERSEQISKQNKQINDSIHYAKSIQNAILPFPTLLNKIAEVAILFKPKDVVSGDFYWHAKVDMPENIQYHFYAVVDCTGHGVPGAFMSMIGSSLLNEIVCVQKKVIPNEILKELDFQIRSSLKQDETNNMDGMDVCMCAFEFYDGHVRKLHYSGAKRNLLFFNHNEKKLYTIQSDRRSIGGVKFDPSELFSLESIDVNENDLFVLFTDGIIDQNDKDRKRFGSKTFTSIIEKNVNESPALIANVIDHELTVFMDKEVQRDDITVMIIKL